MTTLCLLGASGSIGKQTLDVIEAFPGRFSLKSFSVGDRIHLIDGILSRHPEVTAITVKDAALVEALKQKYPQIAFFSGDDGLIELLKHVPVAMVVNALVGFVGLAPTLYALKHGLDVALANKEALVVGGPLVKAAQEEGHSQLYPIDSEHVALDKLLAHEKRQAVRQLILTASGGPLYRLGREELKHVTIEQALAHPTWSMGPKITIDSATMMNKGFEIIEAHYLFDFPIKDIEVWIHPTSKIHSMIQMVDGTLLADVGLNNMHIPIAYALFKRKRVCLPFLKYEPTPETLGLLELRRVAPERFPALALAREAVAVGGTLPAVLNAANEVAVQAFLKSELRFDQIEAVVETLMHGHNVILKPTLDDLIRTDYWARSRARQLIKEWQV
ncbi:MAG: 1-deoxy-D-xylulose-5-phosphate reductoisomerase [Bacilli bacterium]|jgi:1-deoxy-D-xylulose-5-phosphate reductoisomerase